mmetsp:Transcript_2807/g.12576  ORF Transcript_2807/g.12576 Transcript_2807/m.12576 type:complete len:327 (+) Transcript_2807:317-1297(+)
MKPRSEPYTASNARASDLELAPSASQSSTKSTKSTSSPWTPPTVPVPIPVPGCRLFVPIPVPPTPNARALLANSRAAATCLSSPSLSASVSRSNSAVSATAPSKSNSTPPFASPSDDLDPMPSFADAMAMSLRPTSRASASTHLRRSPSRRPCSRTSARCSSSSRIVRSCSAASAIVFASNESTSDELCLSSTSNRSFRAMTRLVVFSSSSSVSRMSASLVALIRAADSARRRSRSRTSALSRSCRLAFISWSSLATVSETSARPSRMRVLSSRRREMSGSVSRRASTRAVSARVSPSARSLAERTRSFIPRVSPSHSRVLASIRA